MIRLATTDTSSHKLLVIAEKPSVMNDIAKALGGFTKHDDHYESETHVVAAASETLEEPDHLSENNLAFPEFT